VLSTRRPFVAVAAVSALVALAPAARSQSADITGNWSVSGSNKLGTYTGTGTIELTSDGCYAVKLHYTYASGHKRDGYFVGTFDGSKLSGDRGGKPSMADALVCAGPSNPQKAVYVLSSDGTRLDGAIGTAGVWKESLSRAPSIEFGSVLLVDADRNGKLDDADKKVMGTQSALAVVVPHSPNAVKSPLHVTVPANAKVKLAVTGSGQARIIDASFQDVVEVAESGDFSVIGTSAGDVEITASDVSGKVVDRAKVTVKNERLYVIMFGYQGAEADQYLDGDMATTKAALLPRIQKAGYKVIEDGKSMDQSVITKGLADWNTPDKVVVDWNTTDDDWIAYLERGTIRGWFWGSHGFMEPYPGCPDDQLLTFESRVWTAVLGDPRSTESKHFMRQWKEHLDDHPYKLDFAIMHACCTGGLGSYADECWQYCDSSTLARVDAKFGSKRPDANKLDTTRSFKFISDKFSYLQTYFGPSYFGLPDVNFDDAVAAMNPERP
jgi:hypothetical protein